MAAAGRRCTTWPGASSRRSRPSSFRTRSRAMPRSSRSMTAMRDVTVEAELRAVETDGQVRHLQSFSAAASPDRAAHARPRRARRDRRGQFPVPRLEGCRRQRRAQPFLAAALQGASASRRPDWRCKPSATAALIQLSLTAQKPAFHVLVEAEPAGHFSDNAFDILPGETVSLTFTPDDPSASVDAAAFVVRDLHSSYASRSN